MIVKIIKLFLKTLNHITVGDYRAKNLSEIIVKLILKYSDKNRSIKIMDYGSGFQPKVIYYVYKKLKYKHNKNIKIHCFDIYNSKNLKNLNQNKDIIFYSLQNLNLNKTKYDFCLLNDVLHHIGIEKLTVLKNLIIKLQNKAKFVLIKDHFQYGFFSNLTIRVMDFLGNYFNNVSTPKKYFNKTSFNFLLRLSNSKIVEKVFNIKLYQSYFLFMSNPKFNFIYLTKKSINN